MRGKITAGILIALLTLIGFWIQTSYQSALNKPAVQHSLVVEIEKGDSFDRITDKLLSLGVDIDPFWFKSVALRIEVTNKLKAGEYELTPGLTIPQILAVFVEGRAIKYPITFPEGWNLKEILQAIEQTPNLKKTLQKQAAAEISAELGMSGTNPEGWFFPDTYHFEKNTTDVSILKRAYVKMQSVLQEEWQHRELNLPYKTAYEALIMASIVEKETGAKSERAMISGVFTRRLAKGMLLQTDPTVIYGMGDGYKGNIKANDLTTATPYNTYVIQGLPPSPIAMPGRDAIHAALHPDKDNSLYFVAKGDGSHQFSASLVEHNQAVNSFQKNKR
ncbi:endolytic transglycosylase MltG [Methyloglobulus sp.]|uniref:endolytic transglycosylase MltG n=1 Tax=Methyloglobulus sp. TaxID=2518622 RepID=UPI00398A26B9